MYYQNFFYAVFISFCLALSSCQPTSSFESEADQTDLPAGEPSSDAEYILDLELRRVGADENFQLSDDLNHLDPQHLIPQKSFEAGIGFFQTYRAQFKNQKFLAIADFSLHSSRRRLFLVNLTTGEVQTHFVAHGKNSDSDADGWANAFSNTPDSLQSSLGGYMVDETYSGKHGYSVRMDGLQKTNSNARKRAVVMHSASYVNSNKVGRSFGCPAIENQFQSYMIDRLKNGGLLFISY